MQSNRNWTDFSCRPILIADRLRHGASPVFCAESTPTADFSITRLILSEPHRTVGRQRGLSAHGLGDKYI